MSIKDAHHDPIAAHPLFTIRMTRVSSSAEGRAGQEDGARHHEAVMP